MSASQFITMLESKGLLDPELIAELNRQVEQSKVRVTPEAIARILVDNGQLTRFQAMRLVTELNEKLGASASDPSKALRGGRPIEEPTPSDDDSVSDLLPEDDVIEAEPIEQVVEIIDDHPVAVPIEAKGSSARPTAKPSQASEEFEQIQPARAKATPKPQKSPWESFGVMGVGFILALLIIMFIPLYIWFSRGTAKENWELAESAYKNREYDKSIRLYETFAGTFSTDENASAARVKMSLSRIRKDAEKNADPAIALKTAQDELPKVANEPGLTDLRGDITDTLLKNAEKFVTRADSAVGAADRKALIAQMADQLTMINDPRFVGTQERTQNELRIRKIVEDQQRVVREIQRSEDLATTLESMQGTLAARDVTKTYELRRELVRKYPQLETDNKIRDLMAQATGIQKTLVAKSNIAIQLSTDAPPNSSGSSALLINRVNKGTVNDDGSVAFWRAKGSVVALKAATGEVLWRNYIGRDWLFDPRRLTSISDSDVLVSVGSRGTVTRLANKDGSLVWEAKFPSPILEPTIDGDDIFVASIQGDVTCLDAITGQTRWNRKIPQSIDVAVGGAPGKRKRYVAGNHSNLYILSRGSGDCDEVVYLGHNPGTIMVPPIWVLNQLIVFENAGPDYSLMRVYSTNDEGTDFKPAQSPMRLRGHVVVEPQVEGRRIAVTTNLGEIAIMDVEITSTKEKVSRLVSQVANETSVRVTWPLLSGTNMWVASDRLSCFQIQISSQKLNNPWSKEPGDEFTTRPAKFGDVLIHSRVVRGNNGIRIAGFEPASGEMIWETDVGTPVSSLSGDGKSFVAVTAQGAAFALDSKSFSSHQPIAALENMGRNAREMLFSAPVQLKDGKVAMLNSARGNQMLVIDPTRKAGWTTKLVNLDLSGSFPSAEPLAVGNAIAVPLDNSQLMLIDPDNGKSIGSPFQPTISAGERPVWLNPVVLSDQQSIIIADQRRNMYKVSTTGKQLRQIHSQPLERTLKGRLAILNDVVVGVSPGATGDILEFYETGELKRKPSLAVEGRFNWGPYALATDNGAIGLAMCDIEGLIAFDSEGKQLWATPLPQTVLVGTPAKVEGDYLLSSSTGELIRIASSNGQVVARANVGEGISGPPVVLAKGIVVPCDEGCVVTMPIPTAGSQSQVGGAQ